MNEVYYTVLEIRGDYALLKSDQGIEKETAIFLLPDGITDGSRLRFADFEYAIVK